MRLNQYLAQHVNLSRRNADAVIAEGRVVVNGRPAELGQQVEASDNVLFDGQKIIKQAFETLVLHKPVGYICSRRQQGTSPTIYNLLPDSYNHLKPVGRLDKDSSGLLLLTNDGPLANKLTHPSFSKWKVYNVQTNRKVSVQHLKIIRNGVALKDGISALEIEEKGNYYQIRMQEGRNRQIRRTFAALGYTVKSLHRVQFGPYKIGSLKKGEYYKLPDVAQ